MHQYMWQQYSEQNWHYNIPNLKRAVHFQTKGEMRHENASEMKSFKNLLSFLLLIWFEWIASVRMLRIAQIRQLEKNWIFFQKFWIRRNKKKKEKQRRNDYYDNFAKNCKIWGSTAISMTLIKTHFRFARIPPYFPNGLANPSKC